MKTNLSRSQAIYYAMIITVHFACCVLAGMLGWHRQIVIVSVCSVLAVRSAWRLISPGVWPAVTVLLPFYVSYITLSFIAANPLTYPIWYWGLLVSILTIILLKQKAGRWFSIFTLSVIIAFGGLFLWPNIFTSYTTQSRPERYMPYRSVLVTADGTPVNTDSLLGKVVVLDIWHSACGNCIRDFPKTEALYEQYKDDPLVKVFTLNFPLDRDKGIRPVKLTDEYQFGKLYFRDADEYAKFSAEQLPLLLIMDKEGVCRYAGQLNTGWNIFYGNAHRIINKLEHEN